MHYPQGPDDPQSQNWWPTDYQGYPPSQQTGMPRPMPANGDAWANAPLQPQQPYWPPQGQPTGTIPGTPQYPPAVGPQQATWQPTGAAPGGTQTTTRRAWWRYPAGATVLLMLLLVSFLMGHALVTTPPSTTSTSGPAATATPSAQDLQQTIIGVVSKTQPSVVEVTSRTTGREALGSGVILTADGYIVTNDHVVRGYSSYTVTLFNGHAMPARLIGESPENDLAVLKVEASDLQPITFADSSKVEVGQFAIALGNPLGLENSATFGIVSALNRTASEAPDGPAGTLTGLIQTSAAINPGNSGGALVDLQGRLIGIPTLGAAESQTGAPANDIGLVIPSNQVKAVTDQIIQQAG
jgi:S1-C subfamily serine protease